MDHDKMMQTIHDIFDPSLPRLAPGDDQSTRRALESAIRSRARRCRRRFPDPGHRMWKRGADFAFGGGTRRQSNGGGQPSALPGRVESKGRGAGTCRPDRNALRGHEGAGPGRRDIRPRLGRGVGVCHGIPEALRAWRSFLKPGGALGFTELTWLEDGAPDECQEFFANEYPQMTDVESHLATIEECGYELVGRFTLPEIVMVGALLWPSGGAVGRYEAPSDDDVTQAVLGMVLERDRCLPTLLPLVWLRVLPVARPDRRFPGLKPAYDQIADQ